jgi:hypothetical protein
MGHIFLKIKESARSDPEDKPPGFPEKNVQVGSGYWQGKTTQR